MPSDIMVLPASDEHKPRWPSNPDALSKGEKTAIVSIYLAKETAFRVELIGAQGAIYVEGPFAKNGIFTSQLAERTNRVVKYNHFTSTGTAAGAAMLTIPQK